MKSCAIVLLLCLICLFTGCADYYYQEGKTFAECKKDYCECHVEYGKCANPNQFLLRDFGYENKFMDSCMKERGYEVVSEDKLPLMVKREGSDWFSKWSRGVAGALGEE